MSSASVLAVDGCVERPRRFSADELGQLAGEFQIADVSLLDARRRGSAVSLAGILAQVGAKPEARFLGLHSSKDDFHASIPLAAVRDKAVLIYRLEDGPLPPSAGGPLRFFIPDVEGCHSTDVDECASVKYVDRIELTAERGFDNRNRDSQPVQIKVPSEPAESVRPAEQTRPDEPEQPAASAELTESVRLAMVSGVGPRLRQQLLERFETPAGVFAAAPSDLRSVPGIGPKLAQRITLAPQEIDAEQHLEECRRRNVSVLALEDPAYPRMLREIHDPPGVLFLKGAIEPRDALAIAIVGSRHATRYGLAQAERLAGSLSRAGLTIVSGLARGIDAAAHRGALAAGGRTLAVLGSGVLEIYPPEHAALAEEVCAHGAVISEAPPHSPPTSGAFPQRNRIITGLSLGVIVVEASVHSGALISARHAMEQGREVFAVPGPIDSRMSRGCHQLIRDGAKLVESADDVLEELGPLVAPATVDDAREVHHPAELLLNDIERKVLDAVGQQATSIDRLTAESGLPIGQVLATLSVLEMRRLVRRLSGNSVARPM